MARVRPRHLTQAAYLEAHHPDGWLGSWAAPTAVWCQVEYTAAVTGPEGADAAAQDSSKAVLRVAPATPTQTPAEALAAWPLESRVTVHGHTLYVAAVSPVVDRGRLDLVEVTLTDYSRLQGGGWVATAQVTGHGLDRLGRPTAGASLDLGQVIVVPGSSREPLDLAAVTSTQATMRCRTDLPVPADATVEIHGCPLAGAWQVDGDPTVLPTVQVVALSR